MPLRRLTATIAIGLAIFFGLQAIHSKVRFVPALGSQVLDFRAFYCAGEVVNEHRDPYLTEPLRTCENRVAGIDPGRASWSVTPVPFPGYDLAAASAVARLPYPWARLLWTAAFVTATLVCAWLLADLTEASVAATALVLVPTVLLVNLTLGEPTPIITCAIAAAAWFADRKRYAEAALCGAVAMIEPHVGLPVMAALFLLRAKARVPVLACAAVLAAATLAVHGVAGALEYGTSVLPVHAHSEVAADDQMSLTRIAFLLGASENSALLVGSISYLIMGIVGIVLASGLARTYASDAFVAAIPPAAVLLGGSFVHDTQMGAAFPAALLLAAAVSRVPWMAGVAWASIALLLVNGITIFQRSTIVWVALALGAIGWLAFRSLSRNERLVRALGAGVLGTVLFLGLRFAVGPERAYVNAVVAPIAITGNEYASVVWAAEIRALPARSQTTVQSELEKLPIWLGLIGLLTVSFAAVGSAGRVTETAR